MVGRTGNFRRVVGITGCVMAKVFPRNGFMFRKIHFARDWFNGLKIGRLRDGFSIWFGAGSSFEGRLAGTLAPPAFMSVGNCDCKNATNGRENNLRKIKSHEIA